MRKMLLISTVAALGVALSVSRAAAAAEFEELDVDESGLLSLQEVQAVAPTVSEEEFETYDGDADGGLDEDEFALWEQATGQEQPN